MTYAHLKSGVWTEISGPFVISDTSYPPNWPVLVSPAQRAAVGIKTIVNQSVAPPPGKVFSTFAPDLIDVAGAPTRVATFIDAPAPQRRLIPKSTVQERVNATGKLDAVLALLLAPGNAIYYARWFAPDWPNVYFDDPGLLLILGAVGCTAPQIATITA